MVQEAIVFDCQQTCSYLYIAADKMKVFQGRLVHCRNPVVNEEGKREFRIEILERTAIGIKDEGTVRV